MNTVPKTPAPGWGLLVLAVLLGGCMGDGVRPGASEDVTLDCDSDPVQRALEGGGIIWYRATNACSDLDNRVQVQMDAGARYLLLPGERAFVSPGYATMQCAGLVVADTCRCNCVLEIKRN